MSYKFDSARHIHTYDGKPLHGVTSVLKMWGDPGALVNWAANQAVEAIVRGETPDDARKAHLKMRDAAGDKGKQVHSLLETSMNEWIDKKEMVLSEDAVVNSVLDWMNKEGYTPIRSEFPVYNLTHWYAGIMDAVVEKNGERFILDFKTSGSLQTKYFYQCGAYSMAVKDMKEEAKIGGAIIIHIPKGQSFKDENNVYVRYDMEQLEKCFLNILETYKLDQEITKLIKY